MNTLKKLVKVKQLMLVATKETKEKGKKYVERWSKTRDLTRTITKNSDDYYENI